MTFIADLHIHSKYSRATSRDMDLDSLVLWAKRKGIAMLGTGDFTHPAWCADLKRKLEETAPGTFSYRGVKFILSAEISHIYPKGGRSRRVHTLVFAPSFKAVDGMCAYLGRYGNLESDGRPITSSDPEEMVRVSASVDPGIQVVPAHIWTPYYSVFGSRSGFDRLEECFGSCTDKIRALETGLSSDPAMNRLWSALDGYTLISNSDAHSPSNIGREANVFSEEVDYRTLFDILARPDGRFAYTIEFFPEEGKYHWDGHRACGVSVRPEEARRNGLKCPVCGRKMTLGVLNRVESLADRKEPKRAVPYKSVVPLREIVAQALGVGGKSVKAGRLYEKLLAANGTEFGILIDMPETELFDRLPPEVALGIMNARRGDVTVRPGADGAYGTVEVIRKADERVHIS